MKAVASVAAVQGAAKEERVAVWVVPGKVKVLRGRIESEGGQLWFFLLRRDRRREERERHGKVLTRYLRDKEGRFVKKKAREKETKSAKV